MSTASDGTLIAQMPKGELRTFDDNETVHRSLMKDPCKGRFSVKQDLVESNLGAHSFNIERPSGELDELVHTGGRLLGDGSGCFFVAIADKQGDPVREVLVVSRHGLSGPAASVGAVGSFLRAPGGQTELHCQGDGNAVMYDVRPGIIQPEGANDRNGWVPLSTFAGGRIRDFREDGNYR